MKDGGILVDDNQKVFKLCSIMLEYPHRDWMKFNILKQEVAQLENDKVQEMFLQFINYLQSTDVGQLCTNYVSTFDFNEGTTLYLTYTIFGDNRERGPAFVELKKYFEEAGYFIETEELPDYLPLVLEFAAVAPAHITQKIFKVHRKGIEKLQNELEKFNSPYLPLINVCIKAINQYMKKTKAS